MDTILVVDDEKATRDFMARALETDYRVLTAPDAERAMAALSSDRTIALVLSDVRMPGVDGLTFMRAAKKANPALKVVLLTAFGTVDQAVAAMKDGADDFLTKPINLDQLELRVKKALESGRLEKKVQELQGALDEKFGLANITGSSPAMQKVFRAVRQVAASDATVLVEGPSGTGKELIAHAIHGLSPRAQGPFVAVECAALSENLLESELFGHEKGAYTGAVGRRIGRFEEANHGTIFLDEISEIPLDTQVKLLRVLQEHNFQRVGGNATIATDIRVIAATNRDLAAYVREGRFREDLYYRLNVVDIRLPPLCERTGDVALLMARFIREFAEKNGGRVTGIAPAAMKILEAYPWPGNVRELRNTAEKMVVLSAGGELGEDDVPDNIRNYRAAPVSAGGTVAGTVASDVAAAVAAAATGTLGDLEKQKILATVEAARGNRSLAAKMLGISRRTLYRKLDAYGMT